MEDNSIIICLDGSFNQILTIITEFSNQFIINIRVGIGIALIELII